MGKNLLKEEFDKAGFIGPFKVYEEEEAKQLLHNIRIKNLDTSSRLFNNDVNYDRHFDIPDLTAHIGQKAIVEKLIPLMGPDILCWRTEFFPKFPGSNGTEWHQVSDYRYASGEPQLVPIENYPEDVPMDLTVWTVFTDANIQNGCMKFLPGSHKKLHYDESINPKLGRQEVYQSVTVDTQFYGYNFSDFKIDPNWNPNESEAVSIEMKAGEFIIFTARCVHGSHPNTTKRSTRFAISSRYVPTFVRVYPDMKHMHAHGADFDLTQHGCVLVSGKDIYKHNSIKKYNNCGMSFPFYQREDR